MQNLANQHPGHAEIVSVFAAARGLFRRVDHGGGLADNAEELAHSYSRYSLARHLVLPACSAAIADRIAAYIWL